MPPSPSMASEEGISPKAAMVLGIPSAPRQSLDTTIIGHRIPMRQTMKEELEYRNKGAETAIIYHNSKPMLQAGLPYERQPARTDSRQSSSSSMFDAKPALDLVQTGFFTSMAKQQRKNALINLTSFRVAKKTADLVLQSARPERRDIIKPTSAPAAKSTKSVFKASPTKQRTAADSIRGPKPVSPRVSIPEIPEEVHGTTSPVPSLINDSDSPTSSENGSPDGRRPTPPAFARLKSRKASREEKNAGINASKDVYSYFGLPARSDSESTSSKEDAEAEKVQNWFNGLTPTAGDKSSYCGYNTSILSEYMGSTSDGRESVELTTLGYEFDTQNRDPNHFRAFLLPTPVKHFFDKEDEEMRHTSSNVAQASTSARSPLKQEQLFADGASVLDLSLDSDDEECYTPQRTKHTPKRQSNGFPYQERTNTPNSVGPRLEMIHPLFRDAAQAENLSPSEKSLLKSLSPNGTVRRPSWASTASTLSPTYNPDENAAKYLEFENSYTPETPRAEPQKEIKAELPTEPVELPSPTEPTTQTERTASPTKSERLVAVSEEEERLLAAMRKTRVSLQQRYLEKGSDIPIEVEFELEVQEPKAHRRARSDEEAQRRRHRQRVEQAAPAKPLARHHSHSPNTTKSSHAMQKSSSHDSANPRTNSTLEGALEFDPLTRSKSTSARPIRRGRANRLPRVLNKPLPATPRAQTPPASEASSGSGSQESLVSVAPPVPLRSARRLTADFHMTLAAPADLVSPLTLSPDTYCAETAFVPQPLAVADKEAVPQEPVRIASLDQVVGSQDVCGWEHWV